MNMKRLMIAMTMLMAWTMVSAQTALKKVYNEEINPVEQIDQALAQAKSEGKYVVCQLGGNWCPWCLRFADFITKDSTINQVISDNFVYIHVNYNPRKKAAESVNSKYTAEERTQQTATMLQRLGNPVRFGFPVFVVLNENGQILHTQDSSFLEEGKGYDQGKTLRFFRAWTPAAVKGK